MKTEMSKARECTYIVGGQVPPDAIACSLQALLSTRHHPIPRRQFTVVDTFDGRLRRAGARLTRSGVTGHSTMVWQARGYGEMKIPVKGSVSFAWDVPPGPLEQAIAPVIGVRRLLAQADVETSGSLLEMLDDRGKTVARLRIESARARRPIAHAAWESLPTVITVTGLRGYDDFYRRLALVVESRPGVEPSPDDLHSIALRHVGASGPAIGSSVHVDLAPTVRADIGARQIHQALLAILAANEPGLRANLDTEFLHDFRVALRRTRSLLRQIKDVFPADRVEHFSAEFAWIGRLTNASRDLDVLLLALQTSRDDMPAEEIQGLRNFLVDVRDREQQRLLAGLSDDRYRRLRADWEAFLKLPVRLDAEPRNAGHTLIEVTSRRAWRLSRRLAERAAAIDETTAAAQLHQVRIDAKKLRYLVDATPAFYEAGDCERVLGALKKLQQVLGDFNDAHVQERRLIEHAHALAAAGGTSGTLLALGRLAEQRRHRHEHLRKTVADGLSRFCARDVRSACRRAFTHAISTEHAR